MSDFDVPSGPPPPKVPEGWVVRWNEQYKEWFYVNTYTKKSQWEKPTSPAEDPNSLAPMGPPPPKYSPSHSPAPHSDVKSPFPDTNTMGEDERLARQLQDEENARAGGGGSSSRSDNTYGSQGAAADYMNASPSQTPSSFPEQLPPRPEDERGSSGSRGLLGKLLGKNKQQQQHYQGQDYPAGGYGHQPQYGGYPPQQPQGYYGGGYPQQQYGGYPQQGGFGHGPPQQQQRPHKSGGIGMGGVAAGAGAGLLGGVLLGEAISHADGPGDFGGDGGDYGGDGGDFGGDGGDFGGDGGDFGGDF